MWSWLSGRTPAYSVLILMLALRRREEKREAEGVTAVQDSRGAEGVAVYRTAEGVTVYRIAGAEGSLARHFVVLRFPT